MDLVEFRNSKREWEMYGGCSYGYNVEAFREFGWEDEDDENDYRNKKDNDDDDE
jgi:hypothetical protein